MRRKSFPSKENSLTSRGAFFLFFFLTALTTFFSLFRLPSQSTNSIVPSIARRANTEETGQAKRVGPVVAHLEPGRSASAFGPVDGI